MQTSLPKSEKDFYCGDLWFPKSKGARLVKRHDVDLAYTLAARRP